MPMIRVELLSGRTVEQKRDFAQAVTRAASEILGCGAAAVAVTCQDQCRVRRKTHWPGGRAGGKCHGTQEK